jgi:hypothetical protein
MVQSSADSGLSRLRSRMLLKKEMITDGEEQDEDDDNQHVHD